MKVRMGFVSNSSSSSFCIYGAFLEDDKIETPEFLEFMVDHIDDVESIEKAKETLEEDRDDVLWQLETPLGLEYYCIDGDDGVYLGDSWSHVKDDETGRQFKDRVEAQLKKIWPDVKCTTLEEAWRDG